MRRYPARAPYRFRQGRRYAPPRGQRPQRRRGVPAGSVVRRIQMPSEPGGNLQAGDIGGDQFRSADVPARAERQQRRDDRHRWMADHRRRRIVVVEGVSGRPVRQRRCHRGQFHVGAEHRNHARTRVRPAGAADDVRLFAGRTGENAPDGVEDRCLGPCRRHLGQRPEGQRAGERRIVLCRRGRHHFPSLPRVPSDGARSIFMHAPATLSSSIFIF